MLNKEYYDNITKVVKIILNDCNLYDWYLTILFNNHYFKGFLSSTDINKSTDILKDYLMYCFKTRRSYIVYKNMGTIVNVALFGNIFMFDSDMTDKFPSINDIINKDILNNHSLKLHLHGLIYKVYKESRQDYRL
jgi:hypothetical protein